MRKIFISLCILAMTHSLSAMCCVDWTGLYVGGYFGGAFPRAVKSQDQGLTPFTSYYNGANNPWSIHLKGSWIGGGTLGYNFQRCSWVLGIENEIGYLRHRGSALDPNSIRFGSDTIGHSKIGEWYDILALRLGYSYGPFLLYAKSGAFFTRINGSVIDDSTAVGAALIHTSGRKTVTSWTLGAGVEYALCRRISLKGEYLYSDLNTKLDVSGRVLTNPAFSDTWHHTFKDMHLIKFGINYRFAFCRS